MHFAFASVGLVLFCVSFMNCSPTRSQEGCVACGKTREANRKFVATDAFTTIELEGTFERSLEARTLCMACLRAIYHWCKNGKVTKVSDHSLLVVIFVEKSDKVKIFAKLSKI